MFSKILIANRGEVAVRIIRACKEMGISTVAVYSQADANSVHVALADQAICVGGPYAADSYLNEKNIISAARIMGAQAIHPGYGFLAENHEFAKMCEDYGIVFIGPRSEVIVRMGDKDEARRMMKAAGVPTVPGTDVVKSVQEAVEQAKGVGYPLLIKARAGGGGKGIRLVNKESEMENAFLTASSEAEKAFGDGGVYIEKYLSPVKHIEVQLLVDETGNIICLGERECSIQRNNQKLLEESPSPAIDQALREKMYDAARKAAAVAGYTNAGTVEFLLDKDKNFYFMEMNTRLQVEHPVTEAVTGIDIVKWQIRIAAGVPLGFGQDKITVNGHSIECRINARGAGRVNLLYIPGGPGVRFDTALYQDYEIPPYYDSMIGKLIVHSSNREFATRKMQSALCELIVDGVPNNIEEQIDILNDRDFQSGNYDTGFMRKRGK